MMSDAPYPPRALRAAVSGRDIKIAEFHAATSLLRFGNSQMAISVAGGITRSVNSTCDLSHSGLPDFVTAAARTVFMPPPH